MSYSHRSSWYNQSDYRYNYYSQQTQPHYNSFRMIPRNSPYLATPIVRPISTSLNSLNEPLVKRLDDQLVDICATDAFPKSVNDVLQAEVVYNLQEVWLLVTFKHFVYFEVV